MQTCFQVSEDQRNGRNDARKCTTTAEFEDAQTPKQRPALRQFVNSLDSAADGSSECSPSSTGVRCGKKVALTKGKPRMLHRGKENISPLEPHLLFAACEEDASLQEESDPMDRLMAVLRHSTLLMR